MATSEPDAAAAAASEAAAKRKEPEPATDAPKEEKKAADQAPEAKRPKVAATAMASPEPAVVKKQVEYYLSDENLRHDRFFSEKIAGDTEGWLDMSLILSCNKMKAMRATKEDVVAALKDSKLELKEDRSAVRRPGNAALPKLEAKPLHQKKNTLHAHDGGAIACFKGIPAEQTWMQVKEKLKAKLPEKVNLWFVSEVNDKAQCFVAAPPFDGDMQFFEACEIELGGAKVKGEICYGEQLQQTLKTLPKHVRDKRERESRKRQKERNRPILIGNQKFVNVGALRGKVKEILNSRSDGEQLKPEGTDFKLIMALLEFHPKGSEKIQGTRGIKVAKSVQGDSRCFYMIKEGGQEEDVSVKKCIDAVELNPPYVKVEKKGKDEEEEKPAAEKATPSPPAVAAPAAAPASTGDGDAAAKAEEEKKEEGTEDKKEPTAS